MHGVSATSFQTGRLWVRVFSYITLVAVLVGIGAAHVPWMIGNPWSTCSVAGSHLGCVLTFHLFEVPLVTVNILIIWYGLRRFSPTTLRRYAALLTMTVAANLAFFTLETNLLFDSLRRDAPLWESIGLGVIGLLLVSGSALGGYIRLKLEGIGQEAEKQP